VERGKQGISLPTAIRGAHLQLDIRLPTGHEDSSRDGNEGYDSANPGWVDGFVSVRSRSLNHVPIGHVVLLCTRRRSDRHPAGGVAPESLQSSSTQNITGKAMLSVRFACQFPFLLSTGVN
jgi:hypothetical protein